MCTVCLRRGRAVLFFISWENYPFASLSCWGKVARWWDYSAKGNVYSGRVLVISGSWVSGRGDILLMEIPSSTLEMCCASAKADLLSWTLYEFFNYEGLAVLSFSNWEDRPANNGGGVKHRYFIIREYSIIVCNIIVIYIHIYINNIDLRRESERKVAFPRQKDQYSARVRRKVSTKTVKNQIRYRLSMLNFRQNRCT